ncbi:hypothetical protein Mal4_00840 [Maioricimonas rarisocia]|uniref:Uncharacterized protein n=1 Tax=Maioricimonas rarisocia TaxID=2528026 RepID=A0A517Z011_9PLAN|nr:hypothetical protein Mal4_00840 [Maioricimonas rarisocia]
MSPGSLNEVTLEERRCPPDNTSTKRKRVHGQAGMPHLALSSMAAISG